jgi:valyl-tRNA synthetase
MGEEIPKKYKPTEEEPKIINFWNDDKTFSFELVDKDKPLYSIDTPPPYASAGHLHIGHAMSYSHAEFIARYKRMAGFKVFYPMGFDDNGLPTEKFVENKHKVNKKTISREAFIKLCLKETEEVRKTFKELWQRIGLSVDWDQTYSTINPHCQKISQHSFIDLYQKKLLKHIDAPTTWCPKCMTAVAQADFENVDIKSCFNDIIFKSVDKNGKETDLIISTTRPELLPACVGLFANPDDTRYQHLKGKTATVPLFNYEVPIMFDKNVDPEVGTGLMMVCTFGDKEDIEKWIKHKLPLRVCIGEDGCMTSEAQKYEGMHIKKARPAITEDLKEANLLVSQKDIVHAVNVHERCGTEIEFVKKKQWYIDVLSRKEELLEIANKINWSPKFMKVRYDHWVKNLNWDWNISRQRFYGVPFPVWYCKSCGEVTLPELDTLPVDPTRDTPNNPCKCGSTEFIGEEDVMDTWMTSSVTPQINYHWDLKTEKKEMIPMDLRPQAHDIIRTWAFYTIAKSLYHNNDIPWRDIVISGHGQDSKGQKMSKSKGNVVWVDDVLKNYSADALRYWASGSGLGDDCPYQEKDVMTGNKLVTKLWNAFKFTNFLLDDDFDPGKTPELSIFDKWLLNELDIVVKKCTEHFDKYEFEKVKLVADKFFWHTFCDNYLEMVKERLYKPEIYGQPAKDSGQYTLYHALKTMVKIFHPLVPFITESIWQYFFTKFEDEKSIANSAWPKVLGVKIDEKETSAGQLAVDISSAIRRHKSENNKALNSEVDVKIATDDNTKECIELVKIDITGTIKAKSLSFVTDIKSDIAIGKDDKVQISVDFIETTE